LIKPPTEETAAPAAAIPDTGTGPLQELAVAGLGTVVGLGLFMLLALRLLGTGISLRPLPVGAARTTKASPKESVEVWAAPSLVAATIAPAFDDEVTNPFIISRDPMRFTAPPAVGVDRCSVVSRLVALRREPDEMSWPNPERLDVGDEVDVLRQDGPYCYVRTPVGMEGWVPGLTLSGVKAPDPLPGADDGS
jgi:hypothetical protein